MDVVHKSERGRENMARKGAKRGQMGGRPVQNPGRVCRAPYVVTVENICEFS